MKLPLLLTAALLLGCGKPTTQNSDNYYKQRLDLIHDEIREMIIANDTSGMYLLVAEKLKIYKHLTESE